MSLEPTIPRKEPNLAERSGERAPASDVTRHAIGEAPAYASSPVAVVYFERGSAALVVVGAFTSHAAFERYRDEQLGGVPGHPERRYLFVRGAERLTDSAAAERTAAPLAVFATGNEHEEPYAIGAFTSPSEFRETIDRLDELMARADRDHREGTAAEHFVMVSFEHYLA